LRPLYTTTLGLVLAVSVAQAQEESALTGASHSPITPPSVPVIEPIVSEKTDTKETEFTIEELVRQALENSPRLQIASQNVVAAKARRQSATAPANPTLQLTPAFSGNREARDEEIILGQPIDVFGVRRSRAKINAAQVRGLEAENQLAKRSLEIDVRKAAISLFMAQESEKLARIQVEVAQLFRDAAAKRAALGDVPAIQVQRADLELFRLQNDLATSRTERLLQRTALSTLIGASSNSSLWVIQPLEPAASNLLNARPTDTNTLAPIPFTKYENKDETASIDLSKRPDIVSAEATLEAQQAQVQALKKERLPQIELQARHTPFLGRGESSTALRAVVTVPLFDLGSLKGERRAATAEVQALEATVKHLKQQAEGRIESARTMVQSRRENALRYQNQLVPLTLDLLRKTQIGYAQGASTYLEVIEAQRTLRQVQTEYLQALVAIQNAEISLDAALNGGSLNIENPYANSDLRGEIR
jgi:outer membrane protein TolC